MVEGRQQLHQDHLRLYSWGHQGIAELLSVLAESHRLDARVGLGHAPRQHDKRLQFDEAGAFVVVARKLDRARHGAAQIIACAVARNAVLAADMVQGVHQAPAAAAVAKLALVPVLPAAEKLQ